MTPKITKTTKVSQLAGRDPHRQAIFAPSPGAVLTRLLELDPSDGPAAFVREMRADIEQELFDAYIVGNEAVASHHRGVLRTLASALAEIIEVDAETWAGR